MNAWDSAPWALENGMRVIGFPTRTKHPAGTEAKAWQRQATDDPQKVAGWATEHPDQNVGFVLGDSNVVVVDIDASKGGFDAFMAWHADHGLSEIPDTASVVTGGGGLHLYFRVPPGTSLPQSQPWGDLKSSGLVVAPGSIHPNGKLYRWSDEVRDIARMPRDWIAALGVRSSEPVDPGVPLGTHNAIMSALGVIAAKVQLPESAYRAMLIEWYTAGRIVALDPDQPWLEADFAVMAKSASEYVAHTNGVLILEPNGSKPILRQPTDAAELMKRKLVPVRFAVAGLLPEGLGLLASPPKAGKSLLAYQLGVELRLGNTVLGRAPERRPVLYYALEDGERRSQGRIHVLLAGRAMPSGLDLYWDAPRLGGWLEQEVDGWLDDHDHEAPGVVIIDVLAKVRPEAGKKTGMSAYDADYDALSELHKVAKGHVGSTILVVTHDRKAGSEDFVTRVTGTRGVTGAADFVLFLDRPDRGKPEAEIKLVGRDLPDDVIPAIFAGTHWQLADLSDLIGASSQARQTIWHWLAAHGPAFQSAVAAGTGMGLSAVKNRMVDMAKDGQIKSVHGGYIAADDPWRL
jgi:hypothetical protein